jgi:serine/threonine protein kinase
MPKRKLSVTTVAWIAKEAIQAVRNLHKVGLMHRDIKPDNILIHAPGQPRGLVLIDFGMAKHYVIEKEGKMTHIPWINGKSLLGTPRFASRWTHQGEQQSRRDDMVCLAYSLLYLVNGSLPWQGMPIKTSDNDANMNILREKIRCTADILGKNLPVQFKEFLSASLHLEFEEKPQYSKWIRRFERLLPTRFVLDWEPDYVEGAAVTLDALRSSKRKEIRVGVSER